jgi:cell division transport system permease protein
MWNLQTIEFFLREVGANLRRNSLMSLAAVTTVALSLGILGGTFLVALNLEAMARREADKVELCAFLKAESTAAQQDQVRQQIAALPGVTQVTFVSQEETLRRLKKQLGEDLFEGLPGNRMQPSFEVKTQTLDQALPTARTIQDIKGVEKVRCGQLIIHRLQQIVRWIQGAGVGAVVLLGLATSGIINNTIRLTILARQREIRIMQLVGATNWFIRMPFLLEGITHGLVGGLLAIAVLLGGYHGLVGYVNTSSFWRLVSDSTLLRGFAGVLVAIGVLYGIAGSFVSIARFLGDDAVTT